MRLLLLCALFPSVMGFGTRPPLRLAPMQRREAWGVRREMGQRVAPQMNALVDRASRKAILQLLSTCSVGVLASKKNILDKNCLSALSKLIFNIFQPCLLFVSVSTTVSSAMKAGNGAALALLPLLAFVQILIGYSIGKLLSIVFYGKNPTAEGSRFLRACTTFSNSGPLPFVFVDALFRGHSDLTLLPRSVAYISMYLLGWSPLFWVLAPYLLGKGQNETKSAAEKRRELFTRVFSPPILGSIAGLAVGANSPLMCMLQNGGILNPLYEALRTLGAGYLPAVLLVLSGSLLPGPPSKEETLTASQNSSESSSSSWVPLVKEVGAILASRFLFMPYVGLFLLSGKIPFLAAAVRDPLLLFILLLETCMPSAQNLTVILQLQGDRFAAARMARLLLLVYVLGVPAMSFWLSRILLVSRVI